MFFFKQNNVKKMDFRNYFCKLPSFIAYCDNEEYRKCFRKAFKISDNYRFTYDGIVENFEDLDNISKDELTYDVNAAENNMEEIFNLTKDDILFCELYARAAEKMFSTSPKIGQAVLCSYDLFKWYYSCVWYYLNFDSTRMKDSNAYKNLKLYLDII